MRTTRRLCTLIIASLFLSSCSMLHKSEDAQSSSTSASTAKSKAYQATYSSPNNFAYQTQHVYTDGAGKWRLDISGQGPAMINVLDLKKGETTMWAEDVHTYVRRPAEAMDPLLMRVNAEQMQRPAANLGARVIDGHPCHGWSLNGTEVWFDDNYGLPVSTTAGGVICNLTMFNPTAPDPSMFEPPPGYTQAQTRRMPGLRMRTQANERARVMGDVRRLMGH